jgi:hypothetical protein
MTKLYANQIGYSDITPYEVVRIVSDNCLEVRALKTELLNKSDLVFHAGGFAAHCSNQADQQWSYSSDEGSPVYKIRKSKKGVWKNKWGDTYAVGPKPRRHYDFNF